MAQLEEELESARSKQANRGSRRASSIIGEHFNIQENAEYKSVAEVMTFASIVAVRACISPNGMMRKQEV